MKRKSKQQKLPRHRQHLRSVPEAKNARRVKMEEEGVEVKKAGISNSDPVAAMDDAAEPAAERGGRGQPVWLSRLLLLKVGPAAKRGSHLPAR
jgi:hypothetical protein